MNYTYEYTIDGDDYRYSFESHLSPVFEDMLATASAKNLWENHEGNEYTWPITFEIFYKNKSIGKYEVYCEFSPLFSAYEVRS